MEISYNRLFKLLIDKGMKKTELAKIDSRYTCKAFKEPNSFNGFFNKNMYNIKL